MIKTYHILLLPVLTGVAAGVLFCRYCHQWWLPMTFLLLGLGVFKEKLRPWGVIGLSMALGWSTMLIHLPGEIIDLPAKDRRVEARVVSVKEASSGLSLIVSSEGYRARVETPSILPEIIPGDIISFTGQWAQPVRQVDLPMEDDGASSAWLDGISARCYASHDSLYVVGHENDLKSLMWKWRNRIEEAIVTSSLDEQSANFLIALLAGDDSWIGSETRDAFSRAGIAHVLALSGAHVAVIASVLAVFLFPFTLFGMRRSRWLITIAALWAFALMTGMSSSVVRSVIMATIVLGGYALERRSVGLNPLCFAAIVILLFSPVSLWHPGFQLSFIATAAIVAAVPVVSSIKVGGIARWLIGVTVVTIAATIATGAAVAFHFHQLPLMFLVGNVAVVVLMPLILGLGTVIVALSMFGVDFVALCNVVDWLCGAVCAIADWISSLGFGVINDIYFSRWWLLPIYGGVIAFFCGFVRKKMALCLGALAFISATVVSILILSPSYSENELWVTRDKGFTQMIAKQGDSIAVFRNRPVVTAVEDSLSFAKQYTDYLATRKIRTFSLTDDLAQFADSIGVVAVNGKTIQVVGETRRSAQSKVDYLLVTRHFHGDILALASSIRADSIILSSDIPKIRADRYLRELNDASMAARSLTMAPIHL